MRLYVEAGAEVYVPVAKRYLQVLHQQASLCGAPFLSKVYVVDKATIRLVADNFSAGRLDIIEIHLLNNEIDILITATGGTYGFDWSVGKFRQLLTPGQTVVQQSAPTGAMYLDSQAVQVDDKVASAAATVPAGEVRVADYTQKASLALDGTQAVANTDANTSAVLVVSTALRGVLRSEQLFGVEAVRDAASTVGRSVENWVTPISGGYPYLRRRWVPHIYAQLPGYGGVSGRLSYGPDLLDAVSIKVAFLGFCLDMTHHSGAESHGVAELLVSVDDSYTGYGQIHVFLGAADDDPDRTSYLEETGSTGTVTKRAYNDQSGRPLSTFVYDPLEGSAWQDVRHAGYKLEGGFVSVVWDDVTKLFAVYRSGAQLKSGSGYVWHSVSVNGAVLAVGFDDGSPQLYLLDSGAGKFYNGRDRTAAAYLQQIFSGAPAGMLDGEIVPVYESGASASLKGYSSDVATTTDTIPAFGGVEHTSPTYNATRIDGWKVRIREELGALIGEGFRWQDDCWKTSSYTRIRKTGTDNFSVVVNGETYSSDSFLSLADVLPYVFAFGSITSDEILLAIWGDDGIPAAVPASGISNVVVETIQREPIGIVGPLIPGYGCGVSAYQTTPNARGPYFWSGDKLTLKTCSGLDLSAGAVDDNTVQVFPQTGCDGDVGTLKVTDACSMSAKKLLALDPYDPLVIAGPAGHPEAPVVGDFFSASGGGEPYEFSISAGTIDSATGEVISLSGACGMGTVTVTDVCGTTDSMAVRFPSGMWVLQTDDVATSPPVTCTYPPNNPTQCCTSVSYTPITSQGWSSAGSPVCWTKETIAGDTKIVEFGDFWTLKTQNPPSAYYDSGGCICDDISVVHNFTLDTSRFLDSTGITVDGYFFSSSNNCCRIYTYELGIYERATYLWECP